MKKIIVALISSFIFLGCSEDPNPPVAGFTLSSNAVLTYDKVTITSTATGADQVTYKLNYDAYEMDESTSTILFFSPTTFTITQTATNSNGSNTYAQDVVVTHFANTYNLDGTEMPIKYIALYVTNGDTKIIELSGDAGFGEFGPINLIQIFAVAGSSPIDQTYTWESKGPPPTYQGSLGTYDLNMIYKYDEGIGYDWQTYGDGGSDLTIDLVYEDPTNSNGNIYELTFTSYNLNWGDWNILTTPWTWVSQGNKSLSVKYRGPIYPQ